MMKTKQRQGLEGAQGGGEIHAMIWFESWIVTITVSCVENDGCQGPGSLLFLHNRNLLTTAGGVAQCFWRDSVYESQAILEDWAHWVRWDGTGCWNWSRQDTAQWPLKSRVEMDKGLRKGFLYPERLLYDLIQHQQKYWQERHSFIRKKKGDG